MIIGILESYFYLVFYLEIFVKVYGDYFKFWSDDIYDDVLICVKIV